jgi:hypothetical protein
MYSGKILVKNDLVPYVLMQGYVFDLLEQLLLSTKDYAMDIVVRK